MKRLFLLLAVLTLLCVGVAANATVTAITFNGSDIVANAPLTVNTSGTPVIGDGYINYPGGVKLKTFNDGALVGDPAGFNAWLGGLGSGEGISEFNLWLMDGITGQAAMWGENLWVTDTPAAWNSITASAPTGWTAQVLVNPYWTDRKPVAYSATSSAYYLRPGIDPMTFSFTADTNGVPGGTYQIWVGAGYPYAGDTNISGTGGIVGGDGVYSFQRSVAANAAPVPEPMSIVLGIMGLGSIAGFRRFRK